MITTLLRHPLPAALRLETDFALDSSSRIALCTMEVPDRRFPRSRETQRATESGGGCVEKIPSMCRCLDGPFN
jgi:hypothetical protein